ncbi:MAG TPA: TetR/AcrR family transcriptional regulator [Propionibacteriaceae bacterium]|nr:TetR/AcrR family transcriptional regulator [Propionibacteriaceae bacterium]
MSAALDEFAAHGFHDASLNRVIDAAGISKGSMYYYFDSKEDLYTHVTRVELGRLFEAVGPFSIPTETEPDTFWSTLEDYYLRLMTALSDSPQLAALIRGWLAASSSALQQAQQELEQSVMPWLESALAAGQQVGAVRADLPSDLLIAVVVGMGQAMDTWLVTQQPDADALPQLVRVLVGMIRRAMKP